VVQQLSEDQKLFYNEIIEKVPDSITMTPEQYGELQFLCPVLADCVGHEFLEEPLREDYKIILMKLFSSYCSDEKDSKKLVESFLEFLVKFKPFRTTSTRDNQFFFGESALNFDLFCWDLHGRQRAEKSDDKIVFLKIFQFKVNSKDLDLACHERERLCKWCKDAKPFAMTGVRLPLLFVGGRCYPYTRLLDMRLCVLA